MKRAYFLLFVALWTAWINAKAAQVPVSNMQNALSGVIDATIAKRGFTPQDIRIANTTWRTSSALLDSVVAATDAKNARLATLGRTASRLGTWGAIAAILSGGAYALGYYAAKWYYSSDGTVKKGDDPASVNTPAGLPPPSVLYCYGSTCATSASAACQGQPRLSDTSVNGVAMARSYVWVSNYCTVHYTPKDGSGPGYNLSPLGNPVQKTNNTTVCPGTSLTASAGKCPASNFPEPSPAPIAEDSDAYNSMPAADRAAPLPLEPIAEIANDAWRKAASQTGYDGLPYDAANPITVGDVSNWKDANPGYWPTLGDFARPNPISYSDPGTGPITNPIPSGSPVTSSPAAQSPFGLPSSGQPQSSVDPSNSAPNTGTNPSTQPVENLGPDPGIGAPSLEAIPTAQQIIAPAQNVFPSLKSFVVPSVDAQCPTWDVPVLGKLIPLKDHCPLLEQVRPNLYAAMAVVYALMALFIVLRT